MKNTEINAKAPTYLTKSISKRNSEGFGKRIARMSSPLAVLNPLRCTYISITQKCIYSKAN